MVTSIRSYLNSPDVFSYICGEYTVADKRLKIDDLVKTFHLAYFGVVLGDQDKSWASHIVSKTCKEGLRQWTKGLRKGLTFRVPMVWRDQKNHHDLLLLYESKRVKS